MDERRLSMFALIPLWLAMIGGSLTVAGWALDSSVLSLVGVTMFVLGVVLLFVGAVRDSRRSGVDSDSPSAEAPGHRFASPSN